MVQIPVRSFSDIYCSDGKSGLNELRPYDDNSLSDDNKDISTEMTDSALQCQRTKWDVTNPVTWESVNLTNHALELHNNSGNGTVPQ